jgi:multicomponent Na+:H+ antiporter subunit E
MRQKHGAKEPNAKRLRILVYDQDEDYRKFVSETLKDHEVETVAPDSASITDKALSKYDLLILDPEHPSAQTLLQRVSTRYPVNRARLAAFILLFGFWIVMSGHFDLFHLSLGALCALIVAVFSHDLLFENITAPRRHVTTARFIAYLPWLFYQIILANLNVAYLVLSPKMAISPRITRFKAALKSDLSRVVLANSITLTPGTITMDIVDGEFLVHSLTKKMEDSLLTGEMENRVAYVFLEGEKSGK